MHGVTDITDILTLEREPKLNSLLTLVSGATDRLAGVSDVSVKCQV